MGFFAPKADDVYRYVLRMDSARTLTDRFCLSLILVNDDSHECRAFLGDYFVDLCHRTADRIRFVFFADIPPGEVRDLEQAEHDRLYGGRYPRPGDGFLRSLLGRLVGRRPAGPWGWRELTPPGFRGVHRPELTHAELDPTEDAASAIIKAGEAMAFAQRLGIGRHVPCIVIVTDVGAPEVEVLPFGRQSAAEVYHHVRGWVDEFYHANRALFDHWRGVEDEVGELQRTAQVALRDIQNWRDKAREPGRAAARVNDLIASALALPGGDTSAWANTVAAWDRWGLPDRAYRVCVAASNRLAELGRIPPVVATGDELRARLTAAADPDAVEAACKAAIASKSVPAKLDPALRAVLENLQTELKSLSRGFDEQLVFWWRERICRARPTETGYKKARRKWPAAHARGPADLGAEHAGLITAIASLPVFGDPDRAADHAVGRIAATLEADPAAPEWLAQTAEYRGWLRSYFARTREGCPDAVVIRLADVTFGELYPPDNRLPETDQLVASLRAGELPADHPLTRVMRTVAGVREDEIADRSRAQAAAVVRAAAAALAVADQFPRQPPPPAEWESARAALLAGLYAARTELRAEVERLEGTLKAAAPRSARTDPGLFARLHAALDEYDTVVSRIRYPHRDDPHVVRVPLRSSLPAAAGLGHAPEAQAEPKARLVGVLGEVRRVEAEADAVAAAAPALPSRWTPAARLAEAIAATVAPERVEELLPAGLRGDLGHRLREALTDERVRDTLDRTTDAELAGILRAVSEGAGGSAAPPSRRQRTELILSRVGADLRPPLLGEGGLFRQLDDLDARLDALDDDEVTFHGTQLRRAAEQYLKQLLTAYGPLALTAGECAAVPHQTLGPLAGWVVRLLKTTGPADGATPREAVDRLRAAAALPDWSSEVTTLLPRLAQLSNTFPHHIIRGGQELPPAERRARLGELSRTARTVAERLREARLYPICLRFTNVRADSMYTCRFEFDSDPPVGGREVVTFSHIPPDLPGLSGELLTTLYRQTLLMLPVGNPDRLDPYLVPAAGG